MVSNLKILKEDRAYSHIKSKKRAIAKFKYRMELMKRHGDNTEAMLIASRIKRIENDGKP